MAIVGSRDFPCLNLVKEYVEGLPKGSWVISGGTRGVDREADLAARRCGLRVTTYYPDWQAKGLKAGHARNELIIADADRVVAFWTGQVENSGTYDDICIAQKMKRALEVIIWRKDQVRYCNQCGWWLDLLEEGIFEDGHIIWSGIISGECVCGHEEKEFV